MSYKILIALLASQCVFSSGSYAQTVDDIFNYLEYSDSFATAGQPTEDEFELISDAGFERIVYIAFSTDPRAVPSEDKLVRDLGMDYVQIPVVWASPAVADFESFAAVMQRDPGKKTLLHCQANFRASAFGFLYRVLHEGVPIAEAKAEMNAVWEPNETWRQLIFDVLAANGVSPNCEGCEW